MSDPSFPALPSPAWFSRRACAPLRMENGVLLLAMVNPRDELTRTHLRVQSGLEVQAVLSNPGEVEQLLQRDTTEEEDLLADTAEAARLDDSEASRTAPVIRMVDKLVGEALRTGTTDIHLEPEEDSLKVRMRRDGMLRLHRSLPPWLRPALVARIKVMANLDIAEKRLPQDGRIQWDWRGTEIDMRVSTLPTRHGEKCVIRVLRKNATLLSLDQLGMPPLILERTQYLVTRPQGMIFITGPTGSGKSSTLYAGLQQILGGQINITTLEDPVEYDLPGANQVQINEKAGLTFASALRSILRQDPDVILIGEIRDAETARIAVQASQTGHLVLSTLHTNDSISAFTRLRDLGIEPFLIGNAVLAIMAQRLVRRLCPHCLRWEAPKDEWRRALPELPDSVPVAVGCPRCMDTGYNGRLAVFEQIALTPEIRDLILSDCGEAELRRRANYEPLLADGLRKMRAGITSAEEVVRVLLTDARF